MTRVLEVYGPDGDLLAFADVQEHPADDETAEQRRRRLAELRRLGGRVAAERARSRAAGANGFSLSEARVSRPSAARPT